MRLRSAQTEIISNEDVTQIQPVVQSHAFTMGNVDTARQLAGGIYGVENGKWRWTAGEFSFVLATPAGDSSRGANFVFEFFLPEANIRRTGPVTLTAYLNGAQIGASTYAAAGAQRFSAEIPAELVKKSPVVIDCQLDRPVPKGVLDTRELGVVALGIGLERQ